MPFSLPFHQRTVRRLLVALLVCLVPLQGMAAAVLLIVGPLHAHRQCDAAAAGSWEAQSPLPLPQCELQARLRSPAVAADSILVLDDFRRPAIGSAPRATHVASAFGHFHGADTPLRHFHPRTDGSVIQLGDDSQQAVADTDELSISPTLTTFAGLLPAAMTWLAPEKGAVRAAGEPWPALTHDTEPLERPPRAA